MLNINVQNAIEAVEYERREVQVRSNSIESRVGYNSLVRVLHKNFALQVAYFRTEEGGSLSIEEAGQSVYQKELNDSEASQLLETLLSVPTNEIGFSDLLALYDNNADMAEKLWEMIKHQAQREFESGHRAAEVFELADYMKDAWSRASYLAIRESFCEEWKPKGGIEISMIDTMAQAWQLLQFWIRECVKRAKTEPRQENYKFQQWKKYSGESNPKQ